MIDCFNLDNLNSSVYFSTCVLALIAFFHIIVYQWVTVQYAKFLLLHFQLDLELPSPEVRVNSKHITSVQVFRKGKKM